MASTVNDDLDALLNFDTPESDATDTPEPDATAATDDLDSLLNFDPPTTDRAAVLEEDSEPEPAAPVSVEEPVAASKPKRAPRRTRAQIDADEAAAEAAAGAVTAVETESPLATHSTKEKAEEAYLAELRARISANSAAPASEAILTPLQQSIREAEETLIAQEKLAQAEQPVSAEQPIVSWASSSAATENSFLIHIVNDGLVINGRTVYRGQEFQFTVGETAYEQTLDKYGNSFLSLRNDVEGQYARWQEQKIAPGPWRGKRVNYSLADAPSELNAAEKSQWLVDLNASQASEAARKQAPPIRTI